MKITTTEFKQFIKEEIKKEFKRINLIEQQENVSIELKKLLNETVIDKTWDRITDIQDKIGFDELFNNIIRKMDDQTVNDILDDIEMDFDLKDENEIFESKPSAGLSKEKKSDVVKSAKKGEDIGKKGKEFKDIAARAAKQYGNKEKGEKVAGAVMWKNIKR